MHFQDYAKNLSRLSVINKYWPVWQNWFMHHITSILSVLEFYRIIHKRCVQIELFYYSHYEANFKSWHGKMKIFEQDMIEQCKSSYYRVLTNDSPPFSTNIPFSCPCSQTNFEVFDTISQKKVVLLEHTKT